MTRRAALALVLALLAACDERPCLEWREEASFMIMPMGNSNFMLLPITNKVCARYGETAKQ